MSAAREEAVALRPEAAEIARAELLAVLAAVADTTRRARLSQLAAAIDDGELPASGPEAEALGELLELGLRSGRLRAVYGPAGEQAMLRLYRRLPRGRELSASADEVSHALAALTGRELQAVRLDAVGPGAFLLSLSVEGRELSLRLDGSGARIQSIVV